MKIKIVSEKDNPLLKRKELVFIANHEGKATPSRGDLLKEIASKTGANEDTIIIEKIMTETGRCSSRIKVHIYKSVEDVPKHKLEKMKRRTKTKEGEKEKAEEGEEQKEAEKEKASEEEGG